MGFAFDIHIFLGVMFMLFKLFVRGLWVALLFLVILFFADYIVPGKLYDSAFSFFGIVIIFSTIILDYIFSFRPVDDEKDKAEEVTS